MQMKKMCREFSLILQISRMLEIQLFILCSHESTRIILTITLWLSGWCASTLERVFIHALVSLTTLSGLSVVDDHFHVEALVLMT